MPRAHSPPTDGGQSDSDSATRLRRTESGGGRDDGSGGTKNGHRCTVPPAPRPPAPAPPVPATPALGSPGPVPPAPAPPARAPPAPVPPAPAPPAPLPPVPVPPAPGSPAPAPQTPPAPAALVPLVRAPPGPATPAPPVPPAPAVTPAPPRLEAPAPTPPAIVPPAPKSPTPVPPVPGSPAPAPPTPPASAALVPLVRAPLGPAAPAVTPAPPGLVAPAPPAPVPPAAEPPAPAAPLLTLRLQLHEQFRQDLPVLRLHYERGGEFSSDLLRDFCRGEGILPSFTLPDSPRQNGIVERRFGLVMEVARTSMIHVAAPHFLWPFAVQYAAHQLNLWPRVSLPETSPTLHWTGEVGDASVFQVWGSRAFVRDTSADKLSTRAIPFVFLGFVPDAPGWHFYHPTSRRVLPSQDVTFDESVPFYRLFPYRCAPPPPPPLFLAPGPPPVDPLPPQGPAPSGVSQVDPLPGTTPVEVAVGSDAARGAASGGVASGLAEPGGAESEGARSGGAELGGELPGGAEPAGVEPGGPEPEGVEPGGAESKGAEFGGAEPRVAASSGGPAGSSPRLSPQQLREWLGRRTRLRSGATGVGGAGDAGAGGAGVTAGAGGTGGARTRAGGSCAGGVDAGGARAGAAGVGGASAGGAGATGAGAIDPGDGGAGGTVRPRPYFIPLLQQVLGVPSSPSLTPPLLCPPPDQCQPPLLSASPLPAPSPYTEESGGLTERREPVSRPVSPVCTARRVPRLRPPPVPGTHAMAIRPSFVRLRVPLPAPPESSLPEVAGPSFESAAASALVAELLDFAAACRLDYATVLITKSASASPPSVGGECALGTDVLEDRQEDFECLAAAVPRFASKLLAPEGVPDEADIPTPRSYAEAITGPYSSQWQAAMDAKMASWKSTGTYVDEVPPPGANIVDGMWIFRVKRPPGSPPAFKARYVARGFSQRQGADYFQTFSPTPKMTTLRVLLHVAAQRDNELHSLEFSTAFSQGSLHKEIWLRRPPGFTGSFPTGTQWSLQRPVYGLRQAPREWHDTLRTTLAALGFAPSTADPSFFLRNDTSLPPFYVLVYVDGLVFATADTEALTLVKSELQKRDTCTDLGPSALQLPILLATTHFLSTGNSLSAPP
ncbi:unnamed protein product [Closterium sp. NIES-53]